MSALSETRDSMIELHCRRCGTAYTPSRDDLVKGPAWYRLCPRCRAQMLGNVGIESTLRGAGSLVKLGNELALHEHTGQSVHPKRGLSGLEFGQLGHPEKSDAGKPSAQSAHLKNLTKPETAAPDADTIGHLGHVPGLALFPIFSDAEDPRPKALSETAPGAIGRFAHRQCAALIMRARPHHAERCTGQRSVGWVLMARRIKTKTINSHLNAASKHRHGVLMIEIGRQLGVSDWCCLARKLPITSHLWNPHECLEPP